MAFGLDNIMITLEMEISTIKLMNILVVIKVI